MRPAVQPSLRRTHHPRSPTISHDLARVPGRCSIYRVAVKQSCENFGVAFRYCSLQVSRLWFGFGADGASCPRRIASHALAIDDGRTLAWKFCGPARSARASWRRQRRLGCAKFYLLESAPRVRDGGDSSVGVASRSKSWVGARRGVSETSAERPWRLGVLPSPRST